MTEQNAVGQGTLVKVQIRHAGMMILQETYLVSRPGDLSRVTADAQANAARRHGEIPAADLMARIDPEPWSRMPAPAATP